MPLRMLKTLLAVALLSVALTATAGTFLTEQLAYSRVRAARDAGGERLAQRFAAAGAAYPPKAIYLRHFKRDRELELWAKGPGGVYVKVHTYPVCARSGGLGPKRRQGDGQVPEGFYAIDRFNPSSSYHLSLGVNYPNEADRILGETGRLGGDIFIHGSCVTIGCIPIEDAPVDEVYWAAIQAHDAGQRSIPVHIFPTRLDDGGMASLKEAYAELPELVDLWTQLQPAYLHFEAHHTLPSVRVDKAGRYVVAP